MNKNMPIRLEYKKFNALVMTKESPEIKDIFIGYNNAGQEEKKVTIEFTINDRTKALVMDYLGPYIIKADSRMLLGQEYVLSKKLAEKKGLVLRLKLLDKGNIIDETEAAL